MWTNGPAITVMASSVLFRNPGQEAPAAAFLSAQPIRPLSILHLAGYKGVLQADA
jgi:hypothetical protein